MARKSLIVHPYACQLTICTTEAEFLRACRRELDYSLSEAEDKIADEPSGVTCWDRSDIVVGWFDGEPGTLVHELVHVGITVLKLCDIDPTHAQGEPLAYLVDNLYSRVLSKKKE